MKQFHILYEQESTFLEKLKEIQDWQSAHHAPLAIFRIFSEDMNRMHIMRVCELLDEHMPQALYFGCTSNANIMDGSLTRAKIILTCTVMEYDTTQAMLLQYPFLEQDVQADVADLKKRCEENPWVSAVEMVATIMDMSMREFCTEMSGLPGGIQVFGGGAFNPNMDDDTAAVFSKGGGFSQHGIVFLLLGGKDFHTYSTFIAGWKPLKRRFQITKADKAVLYELDGHPAFQVYQRFLNISKNDKFFSNTLEFPLFMEHDDVDILRCPMAVGDDDSLIMSSDMEENAIVRLAYGDPETILHSIRKDGQKIADFQPEVIQTFSCAARRAFWGDENISNETNLFQAVAPTAGFYTHGEFLRIGSDMLNFNVTLVIAAMREGEPKAAEGLNIYDAQLEHSGKIPIIWRFVSFIEASTTELEEMNVRLALTSVTDGLTRLYNRSEIERRIQSALQARTPSAPLSLIMLDIDNFKKVNDTYGHKEGDHVIIALSDVLRQTMIGTHSSSIGRWGGEEFMVLLADSDIEETQRLAEAIRASFAAISYETAGCQTVSIGITQAREDEVLDSICTRVDKALYTAKANGKNQVVRID